MAAGLTLLDVADGNPEACRKVGGAIAWIGRGGILVPSARNDGNNLVILIGPGGEAEIERISSDVLFDADSA